MLLQKSKIVEEIEIELHNILKYWSKKMVDEKHGGFIGEINFEEKKDIEIRIF